MSENNDIILVIINKCWETIPDSNKPTYSEFNKVFPVGKNKTLLRNLEQEIPKIGIAKFDTPSEGISILTFIATITDLIYGKRLAATIDDKTNKILNWTWYVE